MQPQDKPRRYTATLTPQQVYDARQAAFAGGLPLAASDAEVIAWAVQRASTLTGAPLVQQLGELRLNDGRKAYPAECAYIAWEGAGISVPKATEGLTCVDAQIDGATALVLVEAANE